MCREETLVLLRRVQAGDASIDALVERLYDRFCQLASRILSDYAFLRCRGIETEDVLHDVQTAFTELANVESDQHLFNRVALSIRNRLKDLAQLRANQVERSDLETVLANIESGERPGTDWVRLQLDLHTAIDKLPDEEREVMERYFYFDLTQTEIVEILGISESTVRRRLLHAKESLAKSLSDDG